MNDMLTGIEDVRPEEEEDFQDMSDDIADDIPQDADATDKFDDEQQELMDVSTFNCLTHLQTINKSRNCSKTCVNFYLGNLFGTPFSNDHYFELPSTTTFWPFSMYLFTDQML